MLQQQKEEQQRHLSGGLVACARHGQRGAERERDGERTGKRREEAEGARSYRCAAVIVAAAGARFRWCCWW